MGYAEDFENLERANAQIDVWIDEEEYVKIKECFNIYEKLESRLDAAFSDADGSVPHTKDDDWYKILNHPKFFPIRKIHLTIQCGDTLDLKIDYKNCSDHKGYYKAWSYLLWAKLIRAKIQEKGIDDYTRHLEDLVTYLQRKIPFPYLDPKNRRGIILQHLYYQELSACGKPGLESLGFAVQAYHVLDSKDDILEKSNQSSFALYKLWAKLNQGIGFWHSHQKMEAALAFNEIIYNFDDAINLINCKRDDDEDLWRSLIFDQAILFKAELQEDLQFSYHALRTLEKLSDRKRERRLIKEALAYRDIGRLKKSENILSVLLGLDHFPSTVDRAFAEYDRWRSAKQNKKGIATQCIGTLIDYYLERCENDAMNDNDVKDFTNKLMILFDDYPDLKNIQLERMSFYQQVARHLKWLISTDHRDKYKEIAEGLYKKYRNEFRRLEINYFSSYEYDRYTESLESFFKEIKDQKYKDDEIDFVTKVREFEKDKNILFQFKEAEREHRNTIMYWNEDSNKLECDLCLKANYPTESMTELLTGCIRDDTYNNENSDKLSTLDYEMIIKQQKYAFLNQIESRSLHKKQRSSIHFLGLQRWNSSTPALALSIGGGYFIYKTDQKGEVELGIAIDPGFNFLENLFMMGFTLSDIDFVLISHGHTDHIRDFEPIVDLLHYMRKNKNKSSPPDKKIHVILTFGVYDRLKNVIADTIYREYLSDTYIIDINKDTDDHIKNGEYGSLPAFEFKRENNKEGRAKEFIEYVAIMEDGEESVVTIQPTWAYHDDNTKMSDSYGFIIQFENKKVKFGYTGDTQWTPLSYEQYKDCHALLIHLGSLIDRGKKFEDYDCPRKCRELIAKKGHPYIFGLLHYMTQLAETSNSRKLILLSEFGEELKGGIRKNLTSRLNEVYHNKLVFLPVDVGLNVRLTKPGNNSEQIGEVLCSGCDDFVKPCKIKYRRYGHGHDEALFYFCNTCINSIPKNIIQEKMRRICDFGIPLQKSNESDSIKTVE